MLKRELYRIMLIIVICMIIGLFLVGLSSEVFIITAYGVGVFYAGKYMFGMIGKLVKGYLQVEIFNLLGKTSVITTLLACCLFAIALVVVLVIAPVFGIIRCICCLVEANRLDKELFY